MRLRTLLLTVSCVGLFVCGCTGNGPNREPVAPESKREQARERVAKTESGTTKLLRGKVIRKGWTKSAESWRAQGSEYYVLDVGKAVLSNGERTAREGVILRPSEFVAFDEFEKYKNKAVEVAGVFVPDMEYKEYYGHEIDPRNQYLVERDPLNPGKDKPAKLGGGFKVNSIRMIDG